MRDKKVSEKRHWDGFWKRSPDVDQVYDNEQRVTRHFAEITSAAGLTVLEVGSGSGRDGITFSRQGSLVVSLDYSTEALELVKSQLRDGDRVRLCCGDAFQLPFRDGTFDLVFHQGLLEHFRNPGDMIEEHRRVLRKGGYLLVDVPQRYHYYTVIKHILIWLGKWFAGWETEFSVRELEKLMERHRFRIVKSYGEWLNPPIWFRMLRKILLGAGIRIPMYPGILVFFRRRFSRIRSFLLSRRPVLYSTVV
ncbi:MAG: methyltransferase domain-containing protein, partial [Candidatus Latescibacteria bacterium]|nr:methyltransferase domain-containing protein [bacterium]MBD3424190.1 methyltransferase domain-containing protein [Candidatus Latescibacterota bacterium]